MVELDGTTGKYCIIYTTSLSIEGTTSINHGELAVLKETTSGATATVEEGANLIVSNYGTFRGRL